MKKTSLLVMGFLTLSALLVFAYAAGGDASDPLASLSYLNGSFSSMVDTRVTQKLDASDAALLENGTLSDTADSSTSTWTEIRLKASDMLTGSTGTNVLVLAGSVQVSFSSGAVVDVTTGTAISSGSILTANHRYLVAEDTSAVFTVLSKTAVVDYQGPYGFSYSDSTDYNAMAAALKTMHLFKGSFTGYGKGYDLEVSPTRLQALIMFIRVLGEEDAALSWSGSSPFTDVAAGTQAAQYVGYAYERGYTNGFSATTFRPAQTITANQYMEFMLRALGYSSTSNTDLSDTLSRAVNAGVITSKEQELLRSEVFLRADLVYISYYALDSLVAGTSETLRDTLLIKGVFTTSESASAQAMVTSIRK
ncbi:S-layer homology domain-containing protein [Oscillibacter sp. PC13]|uniref:S-layer homology domain-containing protein n=1 Tax=Oscillibacter sp. PC13 TaxID=1855299 RepID=UPI0008E00C28|nr:S-layer homology domain-containing protein [Oscillibacter sp. PC13]SFQ03743.1 S-layer homology domain-containing protein [Oscillibacter sp. PC13]